MTSEHFHVLFGTYVQYWFYVSIVLINNNNTVLHAVSFNK